MGWSHGFNSYWNRDIGYGVIAYCDHPGCMAEIDRGLGHVCGGEAPCSDGTCQLFFCGKHLYGSPRGWVCARCKAYKPPYKRIAPEHPDWLRFKLRDMGWRKWRDENPQEVENIRAILREHAKPSKHSVKLAPPPTSSEYGCE